MLHSYQCKDISLARYLPTSPQAMIEAWSSLITDGICKTRFQMLIGMFKINISQFVQISFKTSFNPDIEVLLFLNNLEKFNIGKFFHVYFCIRHCFEIRDKGFNVCVYTIQNRLCRLVVRVPGYRTEMFYVSCEV
jgi:hypothetical protein